MSAARDPPIRAAYVDSGDDDKSYYGNDDDATVHFDSAQDALVVEDESASEDIMQFPTDGSSSPAIPNRGLTVGGSGFAGTTTVTVEDASGGGNDAEINLISQAVAGSVPRIDFQRGAGEDWAFFMDDNGAMEMFDRNASQTHTNWETDGSITVANGGVSAAGATDVTYANTDGVATLTVKNSGTGEADAALLLDSAGTGEGQIDFLDAGTVEMRLLVDQNGMGIFDGAGTTELLKIFEPNGQVRLTEAGSGGNGELRLGAGGAKLYVNGSGEIIAEDEAGNPTQLT